LLTEIAYPRVAYDLLTKGLIENRAYSLLSFKGVTQVVTLSVYFASVNEIKYLKKSYFFGEVEMRGIQKNRFVIVNPGNKPGHGFALRIRKYPIRIRT
jgi:hypothetical protein